MMTRSPLLASHTFLTFLHLQMKLTYKYIASIFFSQKPHQSVQKYQLLSPNKYPSDDRPPGDDLIFVDRLFAKHFSESWVAKGGEAAGLRGLLWLTVTVRVSASVP